MKSKVLSIQGEPVGDIKLPSHFEEPIRPDLIKKAVLVLQSHRRQPYGVSPLAGKQTSAEFVGRRRAFRGFYGRGIARISRTKPGGGGIGPARRATSVVKGIKAHAPTSEKKFAKKINKKERRKAIRSAIAASAKEEWVLKRGHKIELKLPLIIENKFESLKKTKEVEDVLEKLGLGKELERTKKKKIRAGKGKRRSRKYKRKVGPLIVIGEDKGIGKAARNIPGVDVVLVNNLNAELLAPGTHPGRLTLWTNSAIEKLKGLFK